MFEGNLESAVLFISDFQRVVCKAEGRVISEYVGDPLFQAIRAAGILQAQHSFCLSENPEELKLLLASHKAKVLVPLGESALQLLTGLEGISKWHCSVVPVKAEYGARKAVPLYHPEYCSRDYAARVYLKIGCQKIKDQMASAELPPETRKFVTPNSFQEVMRYLTDVVLTAPELAVDIETGRGQINTVGFAISAQEAIAVRVLPEFYTPEEHFALWKLLAQILENNAPKILQNFIYEATWFARYGISIQNVTFDTMHAMKFLHPELEKGLDNVGRFYTDFPYWKDDNDSWNNIRDWQRHLEYNCKDTTGTFEAFRRQSRAISQRGLAPLWDNFITQFIPVIQEMCVRGLLLEPAALIQLQEQLLREKENFERIIETESQARLQRSINPRSHAQVKKALKELGMALPTSKGKESSDKKALIKLRKKYPEDQILPALIGLSASNKQLSSYIEFDYDRATNRVHYSLDGVGTETGRWSSGLSGWGEGFNAQTVPKKVRGIFVAEPGKKLIQIDLSQAESRYVAWESPEPKLMEMLSSGQDVHKYVAARIFSIGETFVSKQQRQLGKKSGHAANYGVGPRTFAEACLTEMDMVVSDAEAKHIIETYHQTFPGVRRRQRNIETTLRRCRKLTTPIGRERHFYGRMDDSTFREAYAYAPQSVIPDITNHLMLALWNHRDVLEVEFLLQVHDSLLLQVPETKVAMISDFAKDLSIWHPKIVLPGGTLLIPVDVEVGERWNPMRKI